MSLEEILQKTKIDEAYFKSLYDLTISRVFNYIVLRTGDRERAKEISQEAYLSLWKSIPNFKYISDGHFYSFLFTVVRRQIIKAGKDKKETIPLEEFHDIVFPENEKEDYRHLLMKVDSLKEKEKIVIKLRYFQDLDFQTISENLGISLANAKVLHHRGIKRLKDSMGIYE